MTIQLNPYLYFGGSAGAAMEFYRGIFGGELKSVTFAEAGMLESAGQPDWVMHSQLTASNSLTLMASDTEAGAATPDLGSVSIIISGREEAELIRCWDLLSADGTVTVPLARAPWNDIFGSCLDKFGVSWIVNVVSDERPIPVD
jgi:PhnB protein